MCRKRNKKTDKKQKKKNKNRKSGQRFIKQKKKNYEKSPKLNAYLRPLRPPMTGFPKCSGCVNGNWSNVSLSLKCLPLFRHSALRLSVVISPSSNTTVYCEQSCILVMVASANSFRSGCLTSTVPPTRNKSLLICSSETVPDPPTNIVLMQLK